MGATRPAMSSSRFSPALQASDLNDFIAPSQDCIISLNKSSSSSRRLQVLTPLPPPGFVVHPSPQPLCQLSAVSAHPPYLFETLDGDVCDQYFQYDYVVVSRSRQCSAGKDMTNKKKGDMK